MFSKIMTAVALLAGATVALAQNAPPADGSGAGRRPTMDPAALFKQLDKNNDGKLSVEEFQSMQQMGRMRGGQGGFGGGRRRMGGGATGGGTGARGGTTSATDRFKAADKNGDGFLSQEEFTSMIQAMRQRMRSGGGGTGGNGGI